MIDLGKANLAAAIAQYKEFKDIKPLADLLKSQDKTLLGDSEALAFVASVVAKEYKPVARAKKYEKEMLAILVYPYFRLCKESGIPFSNKETTHGNNAFVLIARIITEQHNQPATADKVRKVYENRDKSPLWCDIYKARFDA